MGRGLVDPVDLHHDGNAPSHPAVLALVAESFSATKYDIRAMLAELGAPAPTPVRSICRPSCQRAARSLEPQVTTWEAERARLATVLEASQAAASKIGGELSAARTAAAPAVEEWAKASRNGGRGQENAATAAAGYIAAQNALPAKQDAATLVATATTKTAEAAAKLPEDKEVADAAAKLKARTEQLAAEVATLTKAVAEGPAALQATTVALATADQALIVADGEIRTTASPRQGNRGPRKSGRQSGPQRRCRTNGDRHQDRGRPSDRRAFTFPFNGRDRKGRGGEGRRRARDSSPGDHRLPSRNRPHQPGPRRRAASHRRSQRGDRAGAQGTGRSQGNVRRRGRGNCQDADRAAKAARLGRARASRAIAPRQSKRAGRRPENGRVPDLRNATPPQSSPRNKSPHRKLPPTPQRRSVPGSSSKRNRSSRLPRWHIKSSTPSSPPSIRHAAR